MRTTVLSATGILVFIVLSLVDLSFTWLLIQYSGGRIDEGNPIAKEWLLRYGWEGLVVFKLAAIAIVVSVILILVRYRPRTGISLVTFACLSVGYVAYYSYRLLMQVYQ